MQALKFFKRTEKYLVDEMNRNNEDGRLFGQRVAAIDPALKRAEDEQKSTKRVAITTKA